MTSYKRTYARIDLDAIQENIAAVRASLPPRCRLAAVVKADGYGHGAVPVSLFMEELVDFFCVATLEEGINLRYHGIGKPVLILSCIPREDYRESVLFDLRETVFTLKQAEDMNQSAKELERRAKVHIAIDTGMNRIGLKPCDESIALIQEISRLEHIEIEGIFTHFHSADEWDLSSAKKQLQDFLSFLEKLEYLGLRPPLCHIANSAGIAHHLGEGLDMVRCGIAMYGIPPSDQTDLSSIKLRPALSLYSTVTCIKELPAGETVSYGATFQARENMRTATIAFGYADGYPRDLSNKGYVLIRGKKCPILGRICMDQTIVDVSQNPQVQIGDQAVLIGIQGEEKITAQELMSLSHTFPYEFVCGLNKRVPRVYYANGSFVGSKDYTRDIYTLNGPVSPVDNIINL